MRLILVAASVIAFLSLLIAHAQVAPQSFEVRATVVDESGALIPDCKIVFRSDLAKLFHTRGQTGR